MNVSMISYCGLIRALLVSTVIGVIAVPMAGGCSSNKKSDDNKESASLPQSADPFDAGANAPPSPTTLYALARILAAQERYTESISVLKNIIASQPKYIPAYNTLAEVQLRTGQPAEAERSLERGLELAPRDPVLLNNMGMVYFIQERYEEALPYFEQAVEAQPSSAQYRGNQAATLGMLGRMTEANDVYRTIMSPAAADENIDILDRARRKAISSRTSGISVRPSGQVETAPVVADSSPAETPPDGAVSEEN